MKKLIQIFILITVLFLLACTSTTIDDKVIDITTISPFKGNIYQKDLVCFVQKLKEIHPAFTPNDYVYVYNDDFKKFAYDIYKELGQGSFKEGETEQNKFKFCYLATKLLSRVKDSHSHFPFTHTFHSSTEPTIPIIPKWFGNELYVIDAMKDCEFLIHKRITKVNSVDVIQLKPYVNEFISADNDYFKESVNGFVLCRRGVLELLGLSQDDKVNVEYLDNDESKTITLEIKKWKGYSTKINRIMNFPNGVSYFYNEKYNTMMVYIHDFSYDNYTLSCYEKLFREAKEKNAKNIVIDIRNNHGGYTGFGAKIIGTYLSRQNGEKMYSFIRLYKPSVETYELWENDPDSYKEYIENGELYYYDGGIFISERNEELAFNGNVYLITGPNSYSAGTTFAAMIKDNNVGILIGEPTANASTFFTGGGVLTAMLKHTGMGFITSSSLVVRANEEARLREPDAVYPDVYVPTTFEDYINGKDPCWEYLVENVFSKQED